MKKFLALLSIVLFSLNGIGQNKKIDKLIQGINNNQILISWKDDWHRDMKSAFADSLIKIGKPATSQLINVLDHSSKGLIAHFILSSIWNNEIRAEEADAPPREQTLADTSIKTPQFVDRDFSYYLTKDGHPTTTKKELQNNKKMWTIFVRRYNDQ